MNSEKMTIPANILKEIETIAAEVSGKQRNAFTEENIVLSVYGRDAGMQPNICAALCRDEYGCEISGGGVVRIFSKSRLGDTGERERLFANARAWANEITKYICGASSDADGIEKCLHALESHPHFGRITLLYIFNNLEQLKNSKSKDLIMRLNRDFAYECLELILIFIKSECIFSAGENKNIQKTRSIEEYEREIYRLDANLRRVNDTLIRLQDEFEERLEESRAEEREKFITLLNSAQYGYILDLLTAAQLGFKQLRTKKIDVPFEINATPALIRKLLQFVEDCGITPIMEYGIRKEVKLSDIDGCNYEGSHFESEDEIKEVTVTSPGWEIKEKGTVISNPILKETEGGAR